MSNIVKFAKDFPNVRIPSKRKEDAGYDVYAYFDEKYLVIQPHQTVMISTGLRSSFSSNYVAILKERGSTGTKGIGQRCGVIDSGFRNSWMIPITNHNDKPLLICKDMTDGEKESLKEDYILYPYEKAICQVIFLPVPDLEIREVSIEDILNDKSERGDGKIGSSGK